MKITRVMGDNSANDYLASVSAGQAKSAAVVNSSGINPTPGFDWGGFFKGLLGPRAGVMTPQVNDLSGTPQGIDIKTLAVVGTIAAVTIAFLSRKKRRA